VKCPICLNYFIAGEVKFEKLYIKHEDQPWINNEWIRVCPKCCKDNNGVIVKKKVVVS